MAKHRYDDDLFKDSTMTFGEHLEELRLCLVRALIGLGVGLAVGAATAGTVVQWISVPMRSALKTYYQEKGMKRLAQLQGVRAGLAQHGGMVPPYAMEFVDRGGKIYDVYQLDVGLLWNFLARHYPGDLANVTLSRYRLAAGDVRDPARICTTLVTTTRRPAWAERAWSLLDASAQQELREMVAAERFDQRDAARIAEILNALVPRSDFYVAEAFPASMLDAYDRDLVRRADVLAADELAWLNRKLLAAASDGALAPPQAELMPVFFWRSADEDPRTQLSTLSQSEPFMVYMKAAFLVAFVVAFPWVFYQLWVFVSAGLYPHERHYVYIYGPISLILFVLGISTAFFLVFQPVLYFLLSFNDLLGLYPEPRMNEFLGFVLFLPIGFGISFQLPLVMLFLQRIGVFSIEAYLDKWRIAVMVICVVAAVLTPADPWSMIFMAVPLCALYGVGIALCKYMPVPRSPFGEEEEEENHEDEQSSALVGAT